MTLTEFKIRHSTPAMYRWWRGGRACYLWEKMTAHNKAIMRRLFDATMSGEIKGFHLKAKEDEKGWMPFYAYHRSPKQDNTVQLSVGWMVNGVLDPGYDIQMKDFEAMEREGYSSGIWEVIA